jgi:hypothetical protein
MIDLFYKATGVAAMPTLTHYRGRDEYGLPEVKLLSQLNSCCCAVVAAATIIKNLNPEVYDFNKLYKEMRPNYTGVRLLRTVEVLNGYGIKTVKVKTHVIDLARELNAGKLLLIPVDGYVTGTPHVVTGFALSSKGYIRLGNYYPLGLGTKVSFPNFYKAARKDTQIFACSL